MLRPVVVTDLTRMSGNRVCLAGYDVSQREPGACIRPELASGGLREPWLFSQDAVVRPFALLHLDVRRAEPDPPHTEDWVIAPAFTVVDPVVPDIERWAILTALDDGAVAGIFGELRGGPRPFVVKGGGERSLGTIFAAAVEGVEYAQDPESGKWRFRLRFVDQAGQHFDLPVTDLALRSYLDHLRLGEGLPERIAGAHLLGHLRAALTVALRVGVSRPHPDDHERRCYLQVNGVYTEPDYLGGRCFADFLVRTDPGPPVEVPF